MYRQQLKRLRIWAEWSSFHGRVGTGELMRGAGNDSEEERYYMVVLDGESPDRPLRFGLESLRNA